jgi:tRNA1Val (adenine37-N6)-methyltransferase
MSIFRFKKFNIHQDRCAMKVGTDGVLLGAWVDIVNKKKALDIGAGTGLLSLMMAQRNEDLMVQALEIDSNAAAQCFENFQNSIWNDRLQVECISYQEFIKKSTANWDLIVCNPPYFQSGILSDSDARNMARHASTLSADDLFGLPKDNCSNHCIFALIIPAAIELQYCKVANNQGWNLKRKTDVITTIGKDPQRVLLEFSLHSIEALRIDSIVIELGSRNVWSEEYKNLCREFYTIL